MNPKDKGIQVRFITDNEYVSPKELADALKMVADTIRIVKDTATEGTKEESNRLENRLNNLSEQIKRMVENSEKRGIKDIESLAKKITKIQSDIQKDFQDKFDELVLPDVTPFLSRSEYTADRKAILDEVKTFFKDVELDTPEILRDKLETLKDDERLDKTAIKGLDIYDEALANLSRTVSLIPSGGGGSGGIEVFSSGRKVGGGSALNFTGSGVSSVTNSDGRMTTVTITGGGGGGTPGGSTTQLQYNNAGTFDGITGATTDGTLVTLTSPKLDGTPTVSTLRAIGSGGVEIQNNSGTSVIITGAGGGTGTSLQGTTNIGSASADYIQVSGGTGASTFTATGSSTNIDVTLTPKGTGSVRGNRFVATGTAGNGYVELTEQSSKPGTPTNATRLYSDASNRLSWIGENGYVRTFDGTANTADRVYILPNLDGTVALGGSEALTSDVTTTSVTAVDTNLSFAAAANTTYLLTITGTASKASSTTGLKLGIGAPSGSTIKGQQQQGGAAGSTAMTNSLITAINSLGATFATGTGVEVPFRIEATVTTSSTPGNCTLQFATVTSNTATIYAGSRMSWQVAILV